MKPVLVLVLVEQLVNSYKLTVLHLTRPHLTRVTEPVAMPIVCCPPL